MQGKQLAEADAKVVEGSRVYFRANFLVRIDASDMQEVLA